MRGHIYKQQHKSHNMKALVYIASNKQSKQTIKTNNKVNNKTNFPLSVNYLINDIFAIIFASQTQHRFPKMTDFPKATGK